MIWKIKKRCSRFCSKSVFGLRGIYIDTHTKSHSDSDCELHNRYDGNLYVNLRYRLKYLILSFLICLGAVSLTGCETQEEPKTEVYIGMILYDQYDTFVANLADSFKKEAEKKKKETGIDIRIDVQDAQSSQSVQNGQVQEMIEAGVDVICVNLVDRTAPAECIDAAMKAKVPVVFFNRELVAEDLERWEGLYYVGADAFESGVMEGEEAAEDFMSIVRADKNSDGIMQYVVLEGEAGHQDAVVRTEYSAEAIEDAGLSLQKLGYGIANWSRAQAQAKMQQFLDSYGEDIEVVLCNNDEMALGAIDALRASEMPLEERPLVYGIDGTEGARAALLTGELAGTVHNDWEGQAKAMLELSYRLAMGEQLTGMNLIDGKYIRLPYTKMRKEDVQ